MTQEAEFYILQNNAGNETKFITCTIPQDSPYFFTWWTSGKPLPQQIKEPIIYHVYDSSETPEDFPFTNAGQFLVSSKLHGLLEKSGASYESYQSSILIEETGERIDGYYTINFTDSYAVLDRERSKFEADPDFPETDVRTIYELVINKHKVPSQVGIFKLRENQVVTIITKSFRGKLIEEEITGVAFKPVKSV